MSLTPFNSMKMLSELKEKHTDEQLKEFNVFMVNRGFSMGKGTVLFADLANEIGMTSRMVHDFYFNSLPAKKFYNKWIKPSATDENIQLISQFYSISKDEAASYLDVVTDSDIEDIKARMGIGGKIEKNKKKGK